MYRDYLCYIRLLFYRLELHDLTRPSIQVKHSFIAMLNSMSQEDYSMTVRLVQNLLKQRQSKFSVNLREFVNSLEGISQHILQTLPLTGYEECATAMTSQMQGHAPLICNHGSPSPTGKGGDCDFPVFNALL